MPDDIKPFPDDGGQWGAASSAAARWPLRGSAARMALRARVCDQIWVLGALPLQQFFQLSSVRCCSAPGLLARHALPTSPHRAQ